MSPVGFLVVSSEQVRLLPVQPYAPLDRIIELAPQFAQDIKRWMGKKNPPARPQPQTPPAPAGPLD